MKVISGFVKSLLSTGGTTPVPNRKIYAVPTPISAQFLVGGNWLPIFRNTGITDPLLQLGIETLTGLDGRFTFMLPQLSETWEPQSLPVSWNVIDPITGTVYFGQVLDGIPAIGGADLKTLVTTYNWIVKSILQVSGQDGPQRRGVLPFTSSSGLEQIQALLPPLPTAAYVPVVSNAVDSVMEDNYTAYVLPNWTASQFVIRISSPVPVGRTVGIPWHVIG